VGQDGAALVAVDLTPGLQRGQGAEPAGIDDAPVGGGPGEQVGAVRRWDRADELQPGPLQVGEVGGRVLPGVEHHRDLGRRGRAGARGEGGVPPHQQIDHGGELGDIRPVARIGVGEKRHPTVAGDHQAEPDKPQI